jgi:hypothetical protein
VFSKAAIGDEIGSNSPTILTSYCFNWIIFLAWLSSQEVCYNFGQLTTTHLMIVPTLCVGMQPVTKGIPTQSVGTIAALNQTVGKLGARTASRLR